MHSLFCYSLYLDQKIPLLQTILYKDADWDIITYEYTRFSDNIQARSMYRMVEQIVEVTNEMD